MSKIKYTEENKLNLSEQQIEDIKKIVDKYINDLIKEHDNIVAVNLINKEPYIGIIYITFNCNVVRTDLKTNPATIYVIMNSDGGFKVQSLIYDNE